MERLTNPGTKEAKSNITIRRVLDKLSQFEDLEELIGIPLEDIAKIFSKNIPEDCKHPQKAIVLTDDDVDRWNGYKNAEEQCLLLRLPCKVGSIVYYINGKFILEYEVTGFSVDRTGVWLMYVKHHSDENDTTYGFNFDVEKIGKTVFLTQAEAEKKLKAIAEQLKAGEQNDR